MKHFIIYIAVFIFSISLISCERDDEVKYTFLEDTKLSVVEGGGQSGYMGDYLNEEIRIKASSSNPAKRFFVTYEIIKGNGSIYPQNNYLMNNGYILGIDGEFFFSWSLGCNETDQKVKITLYTDSIRLSDGKNYIFHKIPADELIVSASAVKPKGWAKACVCGTDFDFFSKIVSYDNKTLYLVGRGLQYSVDGGINWDIPQDIPHYDDVSDMAFNSKGWAYIVTESHGIFYSKDMKKWIAINNGLLDYRFPSAFYVDDEILMASFYFDGLFISKDNGQFWRKLLVGDSPNQFISRHPNGDLYFWDKWSDCYQSTDVGATWTKLNIDDKYVRYEIEDFTIDRQGKLYIGSGDASIAILDPLTYQGDVHRYYQWNASSQHINNIKITDDDVTYLVNGHPKSGIYSKKNNWDYVDIGFSGIIMNYYLRSDNTYILVTTKGIYYFGK